MNKAMSRVYTQNMSELWPVHGDESFNLLTHFYLSSL